MKGTIMNYQEFKEWDKIYDLRDSYIQENPELKQFRRYKTFKDEDGQIRCAKCGSTSDISGCPECQEEKKFLRTKS
jgi:hypothetical protein